MWRVRALNPIQCRPWIHAYKCQLLLLSLSLSLFLSPRQCEWVSLAALHVLQSQCFWMNVESAASIWITVHHLLLLKITVEFKIAACQAVTVKIKHFAEKSTDEFAEKFAGNLPKIQRTPQKIHPKSAPQNLGFNVWPPPQKKRSY